MSRLHRAVAATAVLAVTVSPGHAESYAAPSPLAAPSAATLDAHHRAVRHDMSRALATAERVHDENRIRALSEFLRPGRRFLSFDPRGGGRAVEVLGDLRNADRIAVLVPGADNTLTNYDAPEFVGGGSRSLYLRARADAPRTRFAVVAWLGYDSPSTSSRAVLAEGHAKDGARRLGDLLTGLHRVNGHARFALLCHSYGSVVCGKAAPRLAHLPVAEIALYGSPGVTVDRASGLGTSARVWAGRSTGDWMRHVPNVRFAGLGFGADPVSPGFGARRFDAGTGPHSAYLEPGSVSLRNLALIALGRVAEVGRG